MNFMFEWQEQYLTDEHKLSAQKELFQGQRFLDFVLLLQKQGKRVGLEI